MDKKYSAEIHYLFNSGFTVQTAEHFFIFDYCNANPADTSYGLNAGIIDPVTLSGLNVSVFASHAHPDHFIPEILTWSPIIHNLRLFLSFDIPLTKEIPNAAIVFPNRSYNLGDIQIRTLKSTDEGVAFLVKADGLTIYHAGDLNWWHWEGEPESDNRAMAREYKAQIDLLENEKIDIAFIPVDPRLNREYLWGLDYFMRRTNSKTVFPMHFGTDFLFFDKLFLDLSPEDYYNNIVRISHRGERFILSTD
ncbi:MAG: MBL fold metallo-hydrolase [Clostridiales bacterium]|nr:MBL fold metallo-hydrolase [Clostridiales bacterium]